MQTYPNLRHVRLFDRAVATGSLSKAADSVRVSQPAASQALAKLEEHFGGPLFERRGSGVHPTPRGMIVAARTGRVLATLRAANLRLARQLRPDRIIAGDLLETHATIAHLRAIAGFARVGSFSGAARQMEQAEPSVQRAARDLERLSGAELFEGKHQSLRLTATGAMMAVCASLVLQELESASVEVRELDGSFDGRIVIGSLPLIRTGIVPDAIAALVGRRPRASIEILDGSYDVLMHGLLIGDIDILLGALREHDTDKGVTQEALFSDGLSVVARSGHPLFSQGKVSPADLARYPWVLPRKRTPTRELFDALVKGLGLHLPDTGVIETGSLGAIRGILIKTDRLTMLSRRQILYEEQAGLLGVVDVELPAMARPIGITTRAGWKPTALQEEFLSALREAARTQ